MGEAGTSPVRERRSGPGSPLRSGRGAASGRSGRPASAGAGRRRVPGEGRQVRPRRRRPGEGRWRRPCVRAGSEAAPPPRGPRRRCRRRGRRGGSPGGPRRPAQRPGCPGQRPAGRPHPVRESQSKTPSATTVQDGAGPRRPIPSTGLGPGRRLEPGRPVGSDGPPDEPADETAGGVGNDHHSGEPLGSPLHEQPCSPWMPLRRRSRQDSRDELAARCPAHSRGPGGLPRAGRRPARPGTPAPPNDGAAVRRRTAPPPSAGRGPLGAARRTWGAALPAGRTAALGASPGLPSSRAMASGRLRFSTRRTKSSTSPPSPHPKQ